MLEDLVEEEAGGEPLALEPPLHVGEGEDDGVDLTARDEGVQLLDAERGCAVCHGKGLLGFLGSLVFFGRAGSHKVLRRTIAWEGGAAGCAVRR